MNGGLTLCGHCGALEPPTVSALRVAAQTAAGTNAWLAANAAELVTACRWVSVHDEALGALLAKRPWVRRALHHAMADVWADPARDATEALDVTEFVAMWGHPHSLPVEFPRLLKHGLLAVTEPDGLNEIYTAVLARLHPTFGGRTGAGLHREGWIYLLGDAANAAYKAFDVEISAALWDEAWQLIDELPPDREASTVAVGYIAAGYAKAIGNQPSRTADWAASLDTAMDRLVTAAARIEGNAASTAVAALMVRLGLSQAQIWYVRRVSGLTGWITAENRRLELLDRTERAMWGYLPPDESASWTHDPGDLPEDLKAAVARLHLEAATAAALVDRARSTTAAEIALRLSTRPHHRFGALLNVALTEPNLARRLAHSERLLREARNDLFGKVSSWQQDRMRTRLAAICRDLGTMLDRVGRPTAAWFWRREGTSWSSRSRGARTTRPSGLLEIEVTDAVLSLGSDVGGSSAADAGTTAQTAGGVGHNIAVENAAGVVLAVMALVSGSDGIEVLRSAAAAMDDWQPELRCPRPGRLEPAQRHTAEDFRRSLLESADEIAAGYAWYLRPELLNKLARQVALGSAERLTVAEEALAVSLEAARWTEATRALRVILAVAIDADDSSAAAYSVHAICGIVQHAVTESRGTADLIDVARQMTAISTRVAAFLAARGYAELAFHAAHASLGAINRIFAEDGQLIEEFELAEQFHQRAEGADDQLFEAMRKRLDRVTPMLSVAGPTVCQPESLLTYMPGPATYVQLFGDRKGGFWAVGCVVDGGSRRWWATRLDVTPGSLSQLRQAVWHSLRPKRTGRQRSTQALGQLHTEIVGRFGDELDGMQDIVFVAHQPFAGIPLHAAHGDNGFLIERHRVTYLSGLIDPNPPVMVSGSAVVGGWDPSIDAPEEARKLEKQLMALGLDVVRPKTAILGRRHYLNPQARWDVAHIAAHGDYQPWPRSLASELRLARTVRLTAGDWLRDGCQASFVFINACNVGRTVPHAGDVNGFPLALRIRGNIAEVSALCPVDSATAGPFAQAFYQRWADGDSLDAYRAACLDAIARGEPPATWAPYVHSGLPIVLAPRVPAMPDARANDRRGRNRGRRPRVRRSR